jgi:hypothetical protein
MRTQLARAATLPVLLGLLGVSSPQAAAQDRGVVPADTVIRARLDERVSSRDARVGERFTASLAPEDRSGFPEGTRFEGTVTEVERASEDEPGVLNMRFRTAVLPDGRRVSIDGRLASLSEEDVRRTSDGRLESRRRGGSGGKFDAKWVGYGAGAGAVLATIFGGGFLKGALLGGLGGAIYGYLNRDKEGGRGDRFKEVNLASGTEFGIRLQDRVAFAPRDTYRYTRRDDRELDGERVAGARDELRFNGTTDRVNGQPVTFRDARPMNVNGSLYVPLEPIARAANLRFSRRAGDDSFSLNTRRGAERYYVGEASTVNGQRLENLEPISIDGEVYVPTEWLSRAADFEVNWDRRGRALDLRSYR